MESPSPAATTTTYRPFDIYGPAWGVNTMWNIECHDMSHVNEELSKVKKVDEVKRVVQQPQCECVFAFLSLLFALSGINKCSKIALDTEPYMIF